MLVTADQRLQHQQNISRFDIGIVVIVTVDTRLPNLRALLPQLRSAIADVTEGTLKIVR